MLKHLQTTVEDLASPHPLLVLFEVSVVTALLPALGFYRHPQDPFFLRASFPWLVLAPLLCGLRYGFVHGVGSAVVLNLFIYGCYELKLGVPAFPGSLALGMLLISMLAGEFCDMWHRRLHHLSELHYHHQTLLRRFIRAYHLLSLSHERLQRRVLGNTKSLRETMTYLRERALRVAPNSTESGELYHLIMEALGSFGLLEVAALHLVNAEGQLVFPSAAMLGTPHAVTQGDPLLLEALCKKQLTCIRAEEPAAPPASEPAEFEPPPASKTLLAAIPLTDVHDRVLGVVAVQAMPFIAFSQEHLLLLAVLGGYLGDMLALAAGGAVHQFHTCLLRSHSDARAHGLPAALLGLVLDSQTAPPLLLSALLERHRALDQQWLTKNRNGDHVLLTVMPLTDGEGARGLVARLESFCQDSYGKSLAGAGVRVHLMALDGIGRAEDKLRALREACEIHGP